MVEFAILLPFLMLMLLGAIEFGRFAYFSIAVGNAAHAGAQYGAENPSNAVDTQGMHDVAVTDGRNNISNITASASQVCSCWNNSTRTETPSTPTAAACGQTCTAGQRVWYVKVDTSGSFNPLFAYPGVPSSFAVSGRAIQRVIQ